MSNVSDAKFGLKNITMSRELSMIGIGGGTMHFDFALAGFVLFVTLGVFGFVATFALMATEERWMKPLIALIIMLIGVSMAAGIGGALWR